MAESRCSLCDSYVPEESLYMHRKIEKAIVDLIKQKNPQWVETDGSCAKCYEYYRALVKEDPEKGA